VTKDSRKKIELTTELGIFMGYTDTPHNYRVYLPTKFNEEKSMSVSLEREIELHVVKDLLAPKVEEPQIDVEQPHVEDPGVETST